MSNKISLFRSIGGKILAIFVGVSIVAIALVAVIAANSSSKALYKNAFNQLDAVRELKRKQLMGYFKARINDAEVIADSQDVHKAVTELIRYHDEMHMDGNSDYEVSGANETAEVTRSYHDIYDEVDGFLKKYSETYGYYDVFLICAKHGHVMYTHAKEADWGANLGVGKYKDTDLAKIWYKCKENADYYVSDMQPYAPSDGAPAMFIGAPVKFNGVTKAVFALQINNDQINAIMQERTGMGESGETYLVGFDKKMRSDSFLDPQGHSVAASFKGTVENNGVDTEAVRDAIQEREGSKIIIDYNGNPVLSSYTHAGFDEELGMDFEWISIAEIDQAEIDEPVTAMEIIIVIAAIIVIAGVAVISWFFSRTLSKPISLITEGANRFAVGDIDLKGMDWKEIEKVNNRSDELGLIGKAFSSLIEYNQEKVNLAEKIADGDLQVDVSISSEEDKLGKSLEKMVGSLNEVLGQVNTSVDQVSSGADQVSSASQSLSQGASEQASSLEEITSSITEINGQTKQNADNAMQANQLSKTSVENAESGNKQMKELVTAMEDINKSSDEIKKVVKVIDDIAFQINLLALNANVEAARAGKFGKGFAVVAEEVRNLAARSAEAVKETTTMVEASVKSIDTGNQLVEATAAQLGEIVEGASKVTDLVEEIATASNEQAQGLDQINKGLGQVDQVTQSNTASAEESASASEELASQAQQLKAMVSRFKLKSRSRGAGTQELSQDMLKQLIKEEMSRDGGMTQSSVIQPNGKAKPSKKKEPVAAAVGRNTANETIIEPKEVISLDYDDFGNL